MTLRTPQLFSHSLLTRDADEARIFISEHIAPIGLRKARGHDHIHFDGSYFVDGGFLACDTRLSAGLDLRPVGALDGIMVRLGMAGVMRVEGVGGTAVTGPGDVLVHATRGDKRLYVETDRHEIVLVLPMALVLERMHEFLGYRTRQPFDFLLPIDGRSPVGASFFTFAAAIRQGLASEAPLLHSPIGLRRHKELLIDLMLCAFAPEDLESLSAPVSAASGADVVLAEDFMRAHADTAIGISDVAAHLGVSIRALQYAFRRHRGTTPLAILQRARLDGARRDLASGMAVSVSAVALHWGFTHFGRFSLQYQAAFGERPSQTLAHGRN